MLKLSSYISHCVRVFMLTVVWMFCAVLHTHIRLDHLFIAGRAI